MRQRNAAKEQYWRRLFRQWRRSGLSVRDFCDEQGVSQPSFYSWRREIERRDGQPRASNAPSSALADAEHATPAFIKLGIEDGAFNASVIDVVLSERRLLRVRPGFDEDLLRQLVRLLEEPSC